MSSSSLEQLDEGTVCTCWYPPPQREAVATGAHAQAHALERHLGSSGDPTLPLHRPHLPPTAGEGLSVLPKI